jgi:hypothetical protein
MNILCVKQFNPQHIVLIGFVLVIQDLNKVGNLYVLKQLMCQMGAEY